MQQLRRSVSVASFGACLIFGLAAPPASASFTGFLGTPVASGLEGGGDWAPVPGGDGFRVHWEVSQNPNGTWHYEYSFSDQGQQSLAPAVSHIILELSANVGSEDLFNFSANLDSAEFGVFGPAPSNPGFPAGESIFGVKVDLLEIDQGSLSFDSTRQPRWSDFYSKGGSDSFVFNTDLGVEAVNSDDYADTPVDQSGNTLHKILAPDTVIPEPAALSMLLLGMGCLVGRCPRGESHSKHVPRGSKE